MDWEVLGLKLKEQRQRAGLSLADVAAETRIGTYLLRAIEDGNTDRLPGDFYLRAFARSYARVIGLGEILHSVPAPDGSSTRGGPRPVASRRQGWRQPPRHVSVGMVVLVSLAAATGLVWWGRGEERGKSEALPALTTRQMVRPAAKSPFVRAEMAEFAPLSMILKAGEECWIELISDGAVVAVGVVPPGYETEVQASESIRLSLGNAGGVSFKINGLPGRMLGRRGQVVKNILMTPGNFREFIDS
jgi:hypothetical protein